MRAAAASSPFIGHPAILGNRHFWLLSRVFGV